MGPKVTLRKSTYPQRASLARGTSEGDLDRRSHEPRGRRERQEDPGRARTHGHHGRGAPGRRPPPHRCPPRGRRGEDGAPRARRPCGRGGADGTCGRSWPRWRLSVAKATESRGETGGPATVHEIPKPKRKTAPSKSRTPSASRRKACPAIRVVSASKRFAGPTHRPPRHSRAQSVPTWPPAHGGTGRSEVGRSCGGTDSSRPPRPGRWGRRRGLMMAVLDRSQRPGLRGGATRPQPAQGVP